MPDPNAGSYSRSVTWVATIAAAKAANAAVTKINNGDLFSGELSSNGRQPATHYWGGWTMTQKEYDDVKAALSVLMLAGTVEEHMRDGDRREGAKKSASQVQGEKSLKQVTMDVLGKPLYEG